MGAHPSNTRVLSFFQERTKEESKQTNESNRQLAETAGNVISPSRVRQSNFSWPKVKESQSSSTLAPICCPQPAAHSSSPPWLVLVTAQWDLWANSPRLQNKQKHHT